MLLQVFQFWWNACLCVDDHACTDNFIGISDVCGILHILLYLMIVEILRLGVIHILRNHQREGGFRNDYANVIFALSNAEFDYGCRKGGRGLETDKK